MKVRRRRSWRLRRNFGRKPKKWRTPWENRGRRWVSGGCWRKGKWPWREWSRRPYRCRGCWCGRRSRWRSGRRGRGSGKERPKVIAWAMKRNGWLKMEGPWGGRPFECTGKRAWGGLKQRVWEAWFLIFDRGALCIWRWLWLKKKACLRFYSLQPISMNDGDEFEFAKDGGLGFI